MSKETYEGLGLARPLCAYIGNYYLHRTLLFTSSLSQVLDSRDLASTNIKKACVKKICEIISDKMGGGIAYDKYLDFGYGTEVQRCKVQKKIKKSQKSVYRGFLE